jgi:hypothetical protein
MTFCKNNEFRSVGVETGLLLCNKIGLINGLRYEF